MVEAVCLDYAFELADALVDRAITDDTGTYWRFIEHRNTDPMLPPGTGWAQGATGIAATLSTRAAEPLPASRHPRRVWTTGGRCAEI